MASSAIQNSSRSNSCDHWASQSSASRRQPANAASGGTDRSTRRNYWAHEWFPRQKPAPPSPETIAATAGGTGAGSSASISTLAGGHDSAASADTPPPTKLK